MILINPQYNRQKKLGGFSRYVPISVPLGIGYLAGYLINNNKKVRVIDEEIATVSPELLDECIKGLERPYIFGLSSLTAGIARAHELAKIIKERYPDSKVLLGSIHPTVMPEEVLRDKNVDIVVRGEGEEMLDLLYERVKNNRDYSDIKGISFRKDGNIIHNENAGLPNLERLPRFPYSLFAISSDKYELGFIASSRGCPYSCIFCSQRAISGRKFRFFPSETVIQDLEEIIYKYHRYYITFMDDSFLMNKKRVIELCSIICQRGFHKKAMFDCQARGDNIDVQILRELKSAGFRTINFGIETASERLMEFIDKRETVRQIIDAVRLAKKEGFHVTGTFILGLPTETDEERKSSYRLAKELSLDYVRFNNATPYPGTKLYEIAIKENRLNAGTGWINLNACGTFVESPFARNELAYVPGGISERDLRYQILKYNLFYSFQPQSIYKILKERVGPAGWLTLPEKWYFKIEEWAHLVKFSILVLCSLTKVILYNLSNLFKISK